MTINEARRLLDAARAGVPISERRISQALAITGDLSPVRDRHDRMIRELRSESSEWGGLDEMPRTLQ